MEMPTILALTGTVLLAAIIAVLVRRRQPTPEAENQTCLIDRRVRSLAESNNFSPRETEIAILLAQGMTAADISGQLQLSLNTVNTYIRRILKKCGGIRRKDFVALAGEES